MTRSPIDSSTTSAQSIQQWLVNHISDSLALDPQKLDVEADFTEYGLNSAEMINISGDLENHLRRPLDPAMILDYPNIVSLSEYLANLPAEDRSAQATGSIDKTNPDAMLANLDQMSDDEVEGLLESLLSDQS
ncbi:MAG: acyl carrier protein [Cyanobacteria bacterium P01_F01_bin.42]